MTFVSSEIRSPIVDPSIDQNGTDKLDRSVLKTASKVQGILRDELGQLTLSDSLSRALNMQSSAERAIPQSQSYSQEGWAQYLKDKVVITANCEPDEAKIIFIGDTLAVENHAIVVSDIIRHYANQTGGNLLLTERRKSSPSHCVLKQMYFPNDRSSTIETWDNEKNTRAHWKILAGQKGVPVLLRKIGESMNKDADSISQEEITVCYARLNNVSERMEALDLENQRLMKIRDNDLIDKVRSSVMDPDRKIFVTAFARRLQRDDFNVIDHFGDVPSAVMIIK